MKTTMRKIAAAVLAVVLAATLCGCDKGYLMKVDGMDIRNGVYIQLMESAYSMAGSAYANEVAEASENSENSEAGDGDTSGSEEDIPITERTIEGKTGSQWIKDETLNSVKRYVAIQRKCDELGITLTDDELAAINVEVNETWENENMYVKYLYGFDTMGEYYESRGIALESVVEVNRVNALQNKLFLHFYQKGGEFEVTDDEINDYLNENYCVVKSLSLPYTSAAGDPLVTDDEKKAVKDKAQGYADRINNGESPVDVFFEHSKEALEESAKASAETKYSADNAEGLTKDEWIKQQIESVNLTKAETPEELDAYITKESTNFDADTIDFIFGAAADGKATVRETTTGVYIIIKEDVTKKTSWKEDNNETFLIAIKGDEFRGIVDLFGQNYEVDADDYLVNKKYGPERLNED